VIEAQGQAWPDGSDNVRVRRQADQRSGGEFDRVAKVSFRKRS